MSLNKSFNILKTIAKVIFGVGTTDFLRKDFHHFLKHTCSLKGNVESPEGNLVSTTNTHSNNTQCNILKNHSSVSEHQNFKNEKYLGLFSLSVILFPDIASLFPSSNFFL